MKSHAMNNLVVVDGYCNLCHYAVRLVMKNDSKGIFHFTARQSPEAKMIFAACNPEDHSMLESVLFVENGRVYTRSSAALRIARKMDYPWPFVYPLWLIPKRFRDFLYDLIARHRYRLFGKKDECSLPLMK